MTNESSNISGESTEMDGWMTCDFTFFLTVFQSYQDDVACIERLCAMEPRLRLKIFSPQAEIEPGTLDQQSSAYHTELLGLLWWLEIGRSHMRKSTFLADITQSILFQMVIQFCP